MNNQTTLLPELALPTPVGGLRRRRKPRRRPLYERPLCAVCDRYVLGPGGAHVTGRYPPHRLTDPMPYGDGPMCPASGTPIPWREVQCDFCGVRVYSSSHHHCPILGRTVTYLGGRRMTADPDDPDDVQMIRELAELTVLVDPGAPFDEGNE